MSQAGFFQIDRKRLLTVVILLCIASLIVLERLYTYGEPLENDINTHAVIGHGLLMGKSLYVDLWNHKPPFIYVTFAAAEAIMGYGRSQVFMLNIIAALVTMLGVYRAASVNGTRAGLWGALFWAVISGDMLLQANQPNTEVFINACVIWAFALYVWYDGRKLEPWRFLSIGVLFALASLYKEVVVVTPALLAIFHVAGPGAKRLDSVKQMSMVAVVGLLAWVILIGYFLANGHFSEFYEANVTFNRFYKGSFSSTFLKSLSPGMLFPRIMYFLIPMMVVQTAGMVYGFLKGHWHRWIVFIIFATGTYFAIAMPGRFSIHYYQLWLPIIAVGAGLGIGSFTWPARKYLNLLPHVVGAAVLAALLVHEVPFYMIPAREWPERAYPAWDSIFLSADNLGKEIDTLLKPDETFYEWGAEAGLYFTSKRMPPTRAFFMYPLRGGPLVDKMTDEVISDMKKKKPELFILSMNSFRWGTNRRLLNWFGENYVFLFRYDKNFIVFCRRGGRLDRERHGAGQPAG